MKDIVPQKKSLTTVKGIVQQKKSLTTVKGIVQQKKSLTTVKGIVQQKALPLLRGKGLAAEEASTAVVSDAGGRFLKHPH